MNRKISDLMDHIRDKDVELEMHTPLSSQRIKELTMSKVNQHKPRRFAFRVLMAAAIVAALAVSAFAAEEIFGAGDWFRTVFGSRVKDGQIQVMNELGKTFQEQTVTSEGTTITLKAAYADENVLYLYLKAEAPEGTVLPDDISYEFCDMNSDTTIHDDYTLQNYWTYLTVPKGSPYEVVGYDMLITPLSDDDPEDNKKDFVIRFHNYQSNVAKFNDGVPKYFHMTGIYQQVPDMDGDSDGYVPLATGDFTFNVGIVNGAEWLELDVSDCIYGGTKSRTWTCGFPECGADCEGLETNGREHTEYWTLSVEPNWLKISSLSAEWSCDYQISNTRMIAGLEFQIVMKDGTSPKLDFGGGAHRTGHSEGTVLFDVPIVLEDIDYILIGDPQIGETHKVYLPE